MPFCLPCHFSGEDTQNVTLHYRSVWYLHHILFGTNIFSNCVDQQIVLDHKIITFALEHSIFDCRDLSITDNRQSLTSDMFVLERFHTFQDRKRFFRAKLCSRVWSTTGFSKVLPFLLPSKGS